MPAPAEIPSAPRPPDWAVERATDEMPEVTDWSIISQRAWQLVRSAKERYDERHDEYDDPDQGGEA